MKHQKVARRGSGQPAVRFTPTDAVEFSTSTRERTVPQRVLSTDRGVVVERGEDIVGERKPLVRLLRLVQSDRFLIAVENGCTKHEQEGGGKRLLTSDPAGVCIA